MHNILIIDKGTSSIHTFKKTLEKKGYRLISEQNITNAIPHLKGGDIDLITIDSLVLSKIRQSGTFSRLADGIPVIVVTDSHTMKEKPLRRKDRNSALLREPLSARDYHYWAERLIRGKNLEDETRLLRSKLQTQKQVTDYHNDIIETFTSDTKIKDNLHAILERTRKMTGASACSLLINDESIFEIIHLRTSKKINRFTFNQGVGIAGWTMKTGSPAIVHDVAKDRRFNKKADSFPNLKITSLLCAPLKMKDRIVGALRAVNKKRGGPFTDDDLHALVNASIYASLAIERTFLHEKLKNDELTNLFNARHLHHVMEMEAIRSLRYKSPFSLLFMDIDNFKKINDKFGHLVGSRALVEIAQILQKNLRKIDIIARYGGDEFVIILPQTPHDGGFMVADRLRRLIEKKVFLKQEGLCISLTASFGVASFPRDAKNKDDLIEIADKAMYRAKFSTKNVVFSAT